MKTYIVFVHMKLTSGQENSIYKVSRRIGGVRSGKGKGQDIFRE